ncbi:hypothetical protein [Devosia aurantiaca]|uniref:Uncharacterized protein n=1 Tax=Devosia aurantiaca TaxID=2714858 RepID=A0A6M1SBB6_9HYPH|nr:hypothetical protein [Devosia aurantiaca]NGP17027.1 hypothetical protein [Devosia aurantiaca]
MRYLHRAVTGIIEHIEASRLQVWKVTVDSVQHVTSATGEAEDMMTQSELLYGDVLEHYLVVADTAPQLAQQIECAVRDVESGASLASFLLVAYQDGGLISVSAGELPFQSVAEAADWWRPR